jgi:hypothetical protein
MPCICRPRPLSRLKIMSEQHHSMQRWTGITRIWFTLSALTWPHLWEGVLRFSVIVFVRLAPELSSFFCFRHEIYRVFALFTVDWNCGNIWGSCAKVCGSWWTGELLHSYFLILFLYLPHFIRTVVAGWLSLSWFVSLLKLRRFWLCARMRCELIYSESWISWEEEIAHKLLWLPPGLQSFT